MKKPLIKLEGIVKEYRQGERTIKALDGVDLQIKQGEFVAVMGPSGCGKSTLMYSLGFLLSPTSGQYWFIRPRPMPSGSQFKHLLILWYGQRSTPSIYDYTMFSARDLDDQSLSPSFAYVESSRRCRLDGCGLSCAKRLGLHLPEMYRFLDGVAV